MTTKRMPTVLLTLLTLFSLALAAVPVLADHINDVEPDTGFEIEGNLAYDGIATPEVTSAYDWENAPYPPAILIKDPHSKSMFEPSIFKPAGKFEDAPGWTIQDGSVGSAQAELTNILVWAIPPGDLGGGSPMDSWLILGMERTKSEGTFALDFELNQQPWTDLSAGPTRTPGDIAVGFELKGNPTDPQTDLQVLIVVYDPDGELDNNVCTTTYGNGNKLESVDKGTDPCPPYGDEGWYYRFLADAGILSDSDYGAGTMNDQVLSLVDDNGDPIGVPEDYISYDSQGNEDGEIGEFEFAEAAINLTELGLDPGCPGFGSVHAKSRSSLEVGSDLKDLAGPEPLPVQCYIEGYKYLDVNGNGTRDDGEPGLNGWTIDLSDGSSALTANDANGDPGYYRFDSLADGSYTVSEDCSNQTGWIQTGPYLVGDPVCGDGAYDFNIDLESRIEVGNFGNGYPDIDMTKACTSVVQVGGTIDYSFTVTNTGNVNLEGVELTDNDIPYSSTIGQMEPGDVENLSTTATAPSTTGEVTNSATATGDFGDSTVFATVSDTDSCTTTVVDAQISIEASDTNFVNADDSSHTFTVTVEKDLGDGAGFAAAPGVSVTSSEAGVGDISGGTCETGVTDSNGQCTIIVDSSATGQSTVHASATVSIDGVNINVATDGYGANTVDNVKTWVDARISIAEDDDNVVGYGHTFTILLERDLGDGYGFVAFADQDVTASLSGVGSFDGSNACTTAADGTCTVSINSNDPGQSTVSASFMGNIVADYDDTYISISTDGASGEFDAPAVKTWWVGRINLTPATDRNGITEPHEIVATVQYSDDGTSWTAAPDGTLVEFNLFNNAPNAYFVGGDDDCTTTNGSCPAFINADAPGTVNIGASSDFTVSGIEGTFSVATGTGFSGPAVEKTYIDGSLRWYKVDDGDNPLGGATFAVQRTLDRFGNAVADAPIIVVDNSSPDADPAAGAFYLTGLKLGAYTIQETDAPQGYRGDFLRIETVELTLDNPNATIAEPWVNTAAQGCTPGFWQGGNGAALWNEPNDLDWEGFYAQPFYHGTEFNSSGIFASYGEVGNLTMIELVGTGGGAEDWRKAARDVVAGYLNASWGIAYPYTPDQIAQMWADAVASGDFAGLHSMLAPANELGCPL